MQNDFLLVIFPVSGRLAIISAALTAIVEREGERGRGVTQRAEKRERDGRHSTHVAAVASA